MRRLVFLERVVGECGLVFGEVGDNFKAGMQLGKVVDEESEGEGSDEEGSASDKVSLSGLFAEIKELTKNRRVRSGQVHILRL